MTQEAVMVGIPISSYTSYLVTNCLIRFLPDVTLILYELPLRTLPYQSDQSTIVMCETLV